MGNATKVAEGVLGLFLLVAILYTFVDDNSDSRESVSKWAVRKWRHTRVQAVGFPVNNCSGTTATLTNSITGNCEFLNSQVGCCQSVSVSSPSIPSSCSPKCKSFANSYYCSVSCLPIAERDTNGKIILCQESVDEMWAACGSCGAFDIATQTLWEASGEYAFASSTSTCFNFTTNMVAASAPPTIINVTTSVSEITVTTAAGLPVVITLFASSESPIFSGSLAICSPTVGGVPGSVVTRTGMSDLSQFKLVNAANNIFSSSWTWYPNSFLTNGTYTVCNASAVNVAGVTVRTESHAEIIVSAIFNGTTYGNLSLASIGVSFFIPQVCSAASLDLNCVSDCGVGASACSVVSIILMNINTPNTSFSGAFTMSITGNLTIGSGSSALSLKNGAKLLIEALMTVTTAFTVDNDGNADSIFEIGSGGTLLVQAVLVIAAHLSLLGAMTIGSGSVVASNRFIMSNANSVVNADGGSLELGSQDAKCDIGSITSSNPTVYGLNVTAGFFQAISACLLSTLMNMQTTPATTGANRRALASTAPPVSKVCSLTGATQATVGHSATIEVLTCSTASGCTCSAATATVPQIAYKINGDLTMKQGSFLKFTEVGGSTFGIIDVAGKAAFESGVNINIFLSSTLTEEATRIPLMRYLTTNTAGDCDLGASVSLGTPITTNRKWDTVCKTVVTAGVTYFYLYLDLDKTPPQTAAQTRSFQFQSIDTYFLLLNKDCKLFGQTEFHEALVRSPITTRGSVTSGELSIRSSACGSVRISFNCRSSVSPQDGDALCKQIVSDAQTPGTPLYNEVRGLQGGVDTSQASGDGSNSALYGLLALIAIPCLCIVACVLISQNTKRSANNQYMEDTARFSNVAASPQPLRQFNAVPPMYEAGAGGYGYPPAQKQPF